MNSKFYILAVAIVVAGGVLLSRFNVSEEDPALAAFARCIKEKEVVMYGADWCPHCQNEKKAFGPAFKYVPYVECPDEPQKCLAAGIESYPTWIMKDGRKFEGELGLNKISELSGCSLQEKPAS